MSGRSEDLATEFYYWREFGFSALRHGHIAQWNRHVFGGAPFFGGWQAGLFYPPNWIYLVLPLNTALNLDIVISTYLAGLFGSILARKYAFHPLACLMAGTIVMFGGAYFPHIWAGHLATLAAMAWVPLILLAVDDILDRPTVRDVLMGAFALAMQIFAGHPQTTFFTAVVLAVYALVRLVKAERRGLVVGALVALGVVAGLLTAVQLFTGIQVNSEGTRSDHVSMSFAALFSFPPEGLITLVVPHVFGDMVHLNYWGRWYLWEACLFVGVAAVPLIVIGFASGSTERRRLWASMAVIFFVVALGKYTPLFSLLYHYAPGLSKFRSYAKFDYEVSIFLALLAAAGLDAFLRGKADLKGAGAIALVLCCALFALGFAVRGDAGVRIAQWIGNQGDSYFDPSRIDIVEFVRGAREFASIKLLAAGLVALLVTVFLFLGLSWRRAAYLVAFVSVVELSCFARSMITTFDPTVCRPPYLTQFFTAHPGDYRILQNAFDANTAMSYGANEIWGYDPMVLRRYSELLNYAEKGNPDDPTMFLTLNEISPTLRVLGCKYVFGKGGEGVIAQEIVNAQPHARVIHRYRVLPSRDDAFQLINYPGFDSLSEAVLDSSPGFAPTGAPGGAATAVWRGTDQIEVDADTDSSGLIVLTDTYSRFWQLAALPGSSQPKYVAMPANYTEIGIPIQPGKHKILLTYRPPMFLVGSWVSGLAWIGLAGMLLTVRRRP